MVFTHNDTKRTRTILLQKHASKRSDEDKPSGKTLFAINIPPYIEEPQLRAAFGQFGAVAHISISENLADSVHPAASTTPLPAATQSAYFGQAKNVVAFKVAHIVFKLTKSLERVLKAKQIELSGDGSTLCVGIDKWTRQHFASIVDEKALRAEVDEYMQAFEAREHEEREEAKKVEVDDDGWTVVKRGKVGGGFQQKQSVLDALERKIEDGKERKEFKNFYGFQIRASKQKHIVSLRKRFAEDKMKIEALKKARRFKPF